MSKSTVTTHHSIQASHCWLTDEDPVIVAVRCGGFCCHHRQSPPLAFFWLGLRVQLCQKKVVCCPMRGAEFHPDESDDSPRPASACGSSESDDESDSVVMGVGCLRCLFPWPLQLGLSSKSPCSRARSPTAPSATLRIFKANEKCGKLSLQGGRAATLEQAPRAKLVIIAMARLTPIRKCSISSMNTALSL
jgi:hypothetical protein